MTMSAKDRLKMFLRAAPKASDKCYAFDLPLSEMNAAKYIHRMRVELARLRSRLRDQGNQIRQFKMLTIRCEENGDGTAIILKYQDSHVNALSAELTDIFSVLADEQQTIDDRDVRGLPKAPGLGILNVKAS